MTKQLWIAIITFVVNVILYFGSKYFDPSIAEDIKFVVNAANILVGVILLHFYGADAMLALKAAIQKSSK
jgi:hypothetical protein